MIENEDFVLVERDDDESNLSSDEIVKITPEDLEEIRAWLSPTEFESEGSEYQKHIHAHTPATGEWLFQTDQYRNWHDSESGALWIQGIPGSGKSVITANLIRSLKDETAPVLFFFSRRIIKSNSDPRNLAQDCLYQLLDHSITLQTRLKRIMQQNQSIESVRFPELWRILLSAISLMPKVYIVFDALDELAVEGENFLQYLLELGQEQSKSIRLLVTSRPLPYIQKALTDSSIVSLRLAGRRVEQDISLYIDHRINFTQSRNLSVEDQSAVKHILCQKGQGLFLYARLMLDEILQRTIPVHDLLQRLPNSLEDMYVDLLHEHSIRSGASKHFQSVLLSWITHASRPLRVTEIAALVNSRDDRAGLRENQDAKTMIRSSCGPLLEILDNETVQVIHHSFTEFLLDSNRTSAQSKDESGNWFPAFTPTVIHRSLTLCCIDYLSSGCLESWSLDLDPDDYFRSSTSEDSRRLMIQFHFLRYASQNLMFHASKFSTLDLLVLVKFDKFFQNGDHTFESWKDFNQSFSRKEGDLKPPTLSSIHVAAQGGLKTYVAYLLRKGEDPDQTDSSKRTAAIYASMNGHVDTLSVLIDHKCSITLADANGLAAIHHAAKGNHVQVLRRLLAAGADPMSLKSAEDKDHCSWKSSTVGTTPIQYACELGSDAVVTELLEHLDRSAKETILPHFAAGAGQANILSCLLQYPEILANINKKDAQGNTALYRAVRFGDSKTVRVLLAHDANIHSRSSELTISSDYFRDMSPVNGKDGYTALQAWAYPRRHIGDHIGNSQEWEKVGALLLEAGCDTEAKNDLGETVLFAWIDQFEYGREDRAERFVSLLLKHGANPCVTSNDGSTPLHKPRRRSTNDRVIGMLTKAGADINHARPKDFVTPLIAAAKSQCVDAVEAYTQHGADPNMKDIDGDTALHCISKSWLLELEHIHEWLSVSDPSIKNMKGETCLYNLRYGNGGQGRVDAIPLLVKHGLDLESKNWKGRTALFSACENGEIQFIAGLLKNGADAKSQDFEGKSCLHVVARAQMSSHDHGPRDLQTTMDVMKSLVKGGADINGTDFSGNTPLHDAIETVGQFKIILKSITKLGGIANISNHRGQTLLHKVARLGISPSGHHSRRSVAERIDLLLEPSLRLDLHARDNDGMMAIHYAASTSVVNISKFIEAGADLRARANDGKTPLHYAAESGESNAVGFLCKLYRDNSWSVDERDDSLRTPLHGASRSGQSECVYHLLKAGANHSSTDRNGLTPLHLVAEYLPDHLRRKERRGRKPLPYWETMSYGTEQLRPYMDLEMLRKGQGRLKLAIAHEDEACMTQDIIRLLTAAGADTTACSNSGQTAYDVALILNNENIAAELLSHNQRAVQPNPLADNWYTSRYLRTEILIQNIDLETADAYTLIESAVSFKSEALLEALLKAGVKPTATGHDKLTAVHTIAHWGLRNLMRVVASYVSDLNIFSPPLLHVAASRDSSNMQMVDLLIELGVDVNATYQEIDSNSRSTGAAVPSYTAGHILAMGEEWWNIGALRSLCDAGADLEIPDADGNSLLQCALNGSKSGSWGSGFWRDETLEVLMKRDVDINAISPKNGLTPLMAALDAKRSCSVIQKILDCGAKINLGSMPAIFAAIESEDREVVAALINAGADVNAIYRPEKIEKWGSGPKVKTPLLAGAFKDGLAIRSDSERSRREDVIALLLECGADPLTELSEGNGNVLCAIAHFHGLIAPILKFGVPLEIKDSDGRTPLLAACFKPSNSSIRVTEDESTPRALIEAGSDICATDNTGSTALHLAIQSGLVKTVELLLSKGASTVAKNHEGLLPLYYAVNYCFSVAKLKMTQALIAAGADSHFTGPAGETPLHLLAPMLIQHSPADCMGTRESHGLYNEKIEYLAETKALYQHFLANGHTPDVRDAAGNTPLFPYVKQVKNRCEYFIIKPPAEEDIRAMLDTHDVFTTNNDGDTLLHVVAAREDKEESLGDGLWLFKELMARGLDPRKENGKGLSALDIAAACEKSSILELFAREE